MTVPGLDRLIAAARAESRPRRIAWLAAAGFLLVVPVVMNVARAPGFESSIELFPGAVPGFPLERDPAYYRAFLAQPKLRQEMAKNVPDPFDDAAYRTVEIRRLRRGTLLVTAELPTPVRSRDFVTQLGPQLAVASGRDVAARALAARPAVRRALRGSATEPERRRLRARLALLDRQVVELPVRAIPGRAPDAPEPERWADRLADSLPGDFPGRPSPVWAGVAGLLVAAALWVAALVLLPPRVRGSGPEERRDDG